MTLLQLGGTVEQPHRVPHLMERRQALNWGCGFVSLSYSLV